MPVAKTVTREILRSLNTAFKTIFNGVFTGAEPMWNKIAEKVDSTTSIETYTWLGQIPGMKEWLDERRIKRLDLEAYVLRNRKFEDTIALSREAVEDDQVGNFKMAVRGLANAAAEHPDELVFEALATGHLNLCYDGQNFFDTDHPVRVGDAEVSVSNIQAGAGEPWYLLCTVKSIKPLVYQDRISAELVVHDDPDTSDRVFMKDEYLYGTRSRGAAGYTYWQMAFRSTADLTAANFQAARQAMASLKGDQGRPLNIVPNLLVVPPSLETAADEIVNVQRTAAGAENPNYKKAEVLMTPWLAA